MRSRIFDLSQNIGLQKPMPIMGELSCEAESNLFSNFFDYMLQHVNQSFSFTIRWMVKPKRGK